MKAEYAVAAGVDIAGYEFLENRRDGFDPGQDGIRIRTAVGHKVGVAQSAGRISERCDLKGAPHRRKQHGFAGHLGGDEPDYFGHALEMAAFNARKADLAPIGSLRDAYALRQVIAGVIVHYLDDVHVRRAV